MRVAALLLSAASAMAAFQAQGAGTPGSPGADHELACQGSPVTVFAPERTQAEIACDAAAEATRYLSSFGFDASRHFVLRLVSRLPAGSVSEQIGGYDRNHREAWVLIDPASFAPEAMFDLPPGAELYRSLIVHEVAHGIAEANFSGSPPGIVAHEYIAYVAQFASLPEPIRRQILDSHPPSTMESVMFLNSYVFLMDPGAFAAIAWRHHQGATGGAAFLKAVLEGRALADPW